MVHIVVEVSIFDVEPPDLNYENSEDINDEDQKNGDHHAVSTSVVAPMREELKEQYEIDMDIQ